MPDVDDIVRALRARGVSTDEAMAQARRWAGKEKVYVVEPIPEAPYAGATNKVTPPAPRVESPSRPSLPTGPPPEGPSGTPTVSEEDSKGFVPSPGLGATDEAGGPSISAADQAFLDQLALTVQSTLYQVIDTTSLQQGPGEADLILWTGRKIHVPFSIAGKSGTFVVSPVTAPMQGTVPVVTPPNTNLGTNLKVDSVGLSKDTSTLSVKSAVESVDTTLGSPAQDSSVVAVKTSVDAVKTTLGTPAQDATVAAISALINTKIPQPLKFTGAGSLQVFNNGS